MAVQQQNVRAYYCALHGLVSETYNNCMLAVGILACLILPLIYYWDEYWFLETHDALALSFFFLQTIYVFMASSAFSNNAAKFPDADQNAIWRLSLASYVLVLALGTFVYVNVQYPEDVFHQAIIEWVTVGLMMSWAAYASFESPYYESVHIYGNIVSNKVQIRGNEINQL